MCKIHQGKNLAKCDSILKATDVREGVKKKPNLFGTLSQTMGRWVQVQSPKLLSENIHSVIFTANMYYISGEVISGHFMML